MPTGPKGQKRPSDAVGNAVHVIRLATGQITDDPAPSKEGAARLGGLKGGKARAKKLTPRQRSEIASAAARARWKNGTLLYTVWYNFARINSAVKMAPAMAAGVSKTLWTMDNIVALIDAAAPAPKEAWAVQEGRTDGRRRARKSH